MVIIADCGEADEEYICGICGFVINEAGECPRCKLEIEEDSRALEEWERETRKRQFWNEIEGFIGGDERAG